MLSSTPRPKSYHQEYMEAASRVFRQASATSGPRPKISSEMIQKVSGKSRVVLPKPSKPNL